METEFSPFPIMFSTICMKNLFFKQNRTEQNGLFFQFEHIRFIVSIQIHIHEYGHVKEKKEEETKKENGRAKVVLIS